MLLARLGKYLIGEISVIAKGEKLEDFINRAYQRGIGLWQIRRPKSSVVNFSMRPGQFNGLRPIVRSTGVTVKILRKSGLPFWWNRARGRKGILAGVVLCAAIIYTMSSFIWFVEVKGASKLSNAQVLKVAGELGLSRGMLRSKVDTTKAARDMKEKMPQVAWVGVSLQGTRILVEIVEKVEKPPAKPGKGNLLAAKTGLITDVLIIKGTAQVKEGQTVKQGEVLIRADNTPVAEGFVRARVWYTASGEQKVTDEGVAPTGDTATSLRLKIGGRLIILTGRKSPYLLFKEEVKAKALPEWRNIRIPVEVITVTYQEMKAYKKVVSREEALKLAEEKAREDLRAKLPAGVKVLKEKTTLEPSKNENVIRVKIEVETHEEIAVHQET